MVHQLHCLDIMRVGFFTNRTGYAEHFEHCLQYMREVVVCNADTTLENAHPIHYEGEWVYTADVVGSTHRCKDWTMLRRYLEENPPHAATAP